MVLYPYLCTQQNYTMNLFAKENRPDKVEILLIVALAALITGLIILL